jgi:Sperm-tail PG-rich repeat
VPGPGKYDPKIVTVKEKSPSWVLGKSDKTGNSKNVTAVPGPGAYLNPVSASGPKWGFGSGKRVKPATSKVPGPGSYEIKSTVGAIPSYSQV